MIVIADDITGAAEIAGIAFSAGHEVQFVCGSGQCSVGSTVTVVATDMRSMTEQEALADLHRIVTDLLSNEKDGMRQLVFLKTDSALRGYVVRPIEVLMKSFGFQRAVYLPANPSKGRIIRNGVYYIGNKPIHETDFSFDPEFPATTSVLAERFPTASTMGIIMPDAYSTDDVSRICSLYNDGATLFAGAADLFTALVEGGKWKVGGGRRNVESGKRNAVDDDDSVIIVCGSTQSQTLPPFLTPHASHPSFLQFFHSSFFQSFPPPISPMPLALYDGGTDIDLWDTDAYAEHHSIVLTIPHRHRTGKEVAVHLRTVVAKKVKSLLAIHRPGHIVIEGGATAWAIIQVVGWTHFTVVRQVAPGVVTLQADDTTLVTLKPGSYPWVIR